jgi:tetratricopeptide (TPR) repeat protein
VAARLEQAAPPGEIYLGPQTHRLVRSDTQTEAVEPLTLKGKAEPVPAFRLISVAAVDAAEQRVDLPMVGRDAELAALQGAFGSAVDGRRAVLTGLIGDAGVGKSRLTEEFLGWAGERARVLQGRCLPYGDGITFWPITEMLGAAAGILEDDAPDQARARIHSLVGDEAVAERMASLAGLDDRQFPVPELFWAVERFAEVMSSEQPLLVVIDDIHWAESTLLDLVAHLQGSVDNAVLLLCTARRLLLEEHPEWGTGEHGTRIVLEPLAPEAIGEMIANYLGTAGIDPAVTARIVEAAQGNPLFVEQFLTMLLEEGLLVRGEQGWAAAGDLADIAVPPSIEALLAARLDRLVAGERRVVEPASVVGRQFPRPAVEHLVDSALRPDLPKHLEALTAKQLVRPWEEGDDLYRFEHLLIRDAAYQGLLKQTRAVLHEQFVEWADRVNRERQREAEFEEILGYHLEQAYRYWSELGPLDHHAVELGERACARLSSAGRRALARGDMPAAAGLLGRAGRVLADDHLDRAPLLLQAGEARFEAGDFETARETITAAAAAADRAGDRGTAAATEIELLRMQYLTGGVEDPAEVVDGVRRLLPELEALDSRAGLARGWRLLASVDLAACRWGDAERAAVQMVEHARAAGDRTMELRVLPILTLFLQKGPTPVPEAIERCRRILDEVSADRRAAAMASRQLAQLQAMQGDFAEARERYRNSRHTLEDLGWGFDAAIVSLDSGPIELLAGDPAAAEAELRRDYEALRTMGDRNFVALTAALLAEALYRQGRIDEAEEPAADAEEVASSDDLGAQVLWRTVRAKLHARSGKYDEARVLIGEACRLIESTEDPSGQADVLVDAAEIARLAGDEQGAMDALQKAHSRYAAKGNLAGARRAEELIAAAEQ